MKIEVGLKYLNLCIPDAQYETNDNNQYNENEHRIPTHTRVGKVKETD